MKFKLLSVLIICLIIQTNCCFSLPNAYFQSDAPVCYGTAVNFTDLSSVNFPPLGWLTTWQWDFGDGSPLQIFHFPQSPHTSHLYAIADTFAVTLTVTDNLGYIDSFTRDVIVKRVPLANFTYSFPFSSLLTQFIDLSMTNGVTIVSWSWDFGDPSSGLSNTSSMQNPQHMFSSCGTYNVSLTINGSNGCSASVTKQVTLILPGEVTADQTINYGERFEDLHLQNSCGNVIIWQRQYNDSPYEDIPGTDGLILYSEIPEFTGNWNYRAAVSLPGGVTGYSSPAMITVMNPGNQKEWSAADDDNWANPNNWNPRGIPVLTDNVVISASVPDMPVVKSSGLNCTNLEIQTGATVVIKQGFSLTVNGNMIIW